MYTNLIYHFQLVNIDVIAYVYIKNKAAQDNLICTPSYVYVEVYLGCSPSRAVYAAKWSNRITPECRRFRLGPLTVGPGFRGSETHCVS